MARYVDADNLEKEIKIDASESIARAVIRIIDRQPTADVEEVKKIEIIRDDLKWWLETNTEKGVVYIPKYVVENMIAKMDGGKNSE